MRRLSVSTISTVTEAVKTLRSEDNIQAKTPCRLQLRTYSVRELGEHVIWALLCFDCLLGKSPCQLLRNRENCVSVPNSLHCTFEIKRTGSKVWLGKYLFNTFLIYNGFR